MAANATTQSIGGQSVPVAEMTGMPYASVYTALQTAKRLQSTTPAATVGTLNDALALVTGGLLAVGEAVSWREYYADTGMGGNTAVLRDAGSSGARPVADDGSIIHAGSAGLYLDASAMAEVDPGAFGVRYGDSADQVVALQRASDFAEASGKELVQRGNITLKSNWYIGNLRFRRTAGVLELVSDGSFVARGTASRNNEGMILTKSAGGAGYGLPTVSLSIQGGFYATFSRPTTNGPLAGVLLENVSQLRGDSIAVITATGQNTAKTPLDFYSAVQNVELANVYVDTDCGTTGVGGFWVRNASLATPTSNIKIAHLVVKHQGADEAVAVFNFSNAATIKNVKFGKVTIDTAASGQALSVMNKFAGSPGVVDDVTFDDVTITVSGSSANMFVVKSENCAPVYSKLRVELNDLTGASGALYALRAISNNDEVTKVGHLTVQINAPVPAGNLDVISGLFEVDNTEVRTQNGATVRRVARAFKALRNCTVDCDYTDTALSIGDEITGTVRGKMEGIATFRGNHILDVDSHDATYWFLHSAATASIRLPAAICYEADVIVRSSSAAETIANIVNANISATKAIPMRITSQVDNAAHDITIGNDYNGNAVALVGYNAVINTSGGLTRRSKTLTV